MATDPAIDAWRTSLATLGSQLVDFESNPTVELARTGCLSGGSATAWDTADAGVAKAWETYRAVDELLDQATNDPAQASTLLSASSVPGPDGPTDPTTAMRGAKAAVDAAVEVSEQLSSAWDDLATRAQAARTAATEAGDQPTARTADTLARLLATDPFAVSVADVKGVEAAAADASTRHAAAKAAVARLDVDLTQARATMTRLESDLAAATSELDHAASRIAGLGRAHPVPDLAQLADWLDRIAATVPNDAGRAAENLASWIAAADARRAELDAALDAARAAMRRRDEGRGLWTALRAKAAARHVDERQEVAAALAAAREELWQAPCDLTVAESELSKLSALLRAARGGNE
ncbi:MAG: hypothetical protein ACRD2C_12880 [Acidimicrobiales bacterium]